jgi:hypothetical protein
MKGEKELLIMQCPHKMKTMATKVDVWDTEPKVKGDLSEILMWVLCITLPRSSQNLVPNSRTRSLAAPLSILTKILLSLTMKN